MSLTPEEIRSQQFRKSFRGADPVEVGSFLDRVAADVESLLHDMGTLQDKVAALEEQIREYKNIEKILQQTLLQAQETGTRTVENARKEAELVMQQAEMRAAEMLNQARRDLIAIKEQITVLVAKKEYIISRVKMLLSAQMETIAAVERDPDLAATQPPPPGDTAAGSSELDDILKQID